MRFAVECAHVRRRFVSAAFAVEPPGDWVASRGSIHLSHSRSCRALGLWRLSHAILQVTLKGPDTPYTCTLHTHASVLPALPVKYNLGRYIIPPSLADTRADLQACTSSDDCTRADPPSCAPIPPTGAAYPITKWASAYASTLGSWNLTRRVPACIAAWWDGCSIE